MSRKPKPQRPPRQQKNPFDLQLWCLGHNRPCYYPASKPDNLDGGEWWKPPGTTVRVWGPCMHLDDPDEDSIVVYVPKYNITSDMLETALAMIRLRWPNNKRVIFNTWKGH
jgi:hypothetical protein